MLQRNWLLSATVTVQFIRTDNPSMDIVCNCDVKQRIFNIFLGKGLDFFSLGNFNHPESQTELTFRSV